MNSTANHSSPAAASTRHPQTSTPATPTAPQLELSFGGGRPCSAVNRRQRRLNRARWWFQRMRQVVDRACDWQPGPLPRPEQIWFRETSLQPALSPRSGADERQMCE